MSREEVIRQLYNHGYTLQALEVAIPNDPEVALARYTVRQCAALLVDEAETLERLARRGKVKT